MWFRDIFSLVTDSEWIGGAAEETRCEIALFRFSHSLMWERCTIHTSFSHAFDPPLWLTKKHPSRGWRLGRFGGSAGRTARRICVLSGATLPPIARLTLSHRYSPNPCASCIAKNARSAPDRFTAAAACRGGVKEAQLQRDTISLGKRASINSCA